MMKQLTLWSSMFDYSISVRELEAWHNCFKEGKQTKQTYSIRDFKIFHFKFNTVYATWEFHVLLWLEIL